MQVGGEESNAAVDIVADAAGGNDSFIQVKAGYSPNGKAITPVNVGHGDGRADDAGQASNVGDLIEALVFSDVGHQRLVSEDDAVRIHPPFLRDSPRAVIDLLELHGRAPLSYLLLLKRFGNKGRILARLHGPKDQKPLPPRARSRSWPDHRPPLSKLLPARKGLRASEPTPQNRRTRTAGCRREKSAR